MMNLINRPRPSEDPAALAYMESELGRQGSELLKQSSEAAAAQGRAGGGAAFAGKDEAMQKSALARGAAIANLKEKELQYDVSVAQLLGQQWQADLQKMGLEKQEQWNALNFWGQLYSMAAAEGWLNNKNFDWAMSTAETGFSQILEAGGTVREAGQFVWKTLNPYVD
jgi:hypothetical protein